MKRKNGGSIYSLLPSSYRRRKYVSTPGRSRRGRTFRKGYDRTGGFYGRFAGPDAERKFKDTVADDAPITAIGIRTNLCILAEGINLFIS